MTMQTVQSSNIEKIGYKESEKVLRIRFKGAKHGEIYCYKDVPAEIYEGFKKAESIGSFFHHNVKDKFEFFKEDHAAR